MTNELQTAADAAFSDAWEQYETALELLDNGDIRNACGMAWSATLTATRAAALANGEDTQTANQASSWVRRASWKREGFEKTPLMFAECAQFLYQQAYCDGHTEDGDIPSLIYQTADYIRQAQQLASLSR